MLHLPISFALVLMLLTPTVSAFDAGETVRLTGQRDSDTYAAGGTVFSTAAIRGDLFATGGTVIIDGSVDADLLVMGGDININASIGDDARITAGTAIFNSVIAGDLLFAGGQLTLSPKTVVQGYTWLAGGQLDLAGQFHNSLNAVGGMITLSGHFLSDVELEADRIIIGPDTQIDGRLVYRSPQEATIDPSARIAGEILYEPIETQSAGKGPKIFFYVSLMFTAILFYLLFSGFSNRSANLLRQEYLKSLGFGLLFLLLVPVLAFISMGIVIGLWLGLILLAIYAIALLTGSFLGMIFTAEFLSGLVHFDISSKIKRMFSILLAYVLLALLQYIPVLGGLTSFVILLSGLGAGSMLLYRHYSTTAVQQT
ncbi:MAG: hypothetical protein OEX03_10215 [Gammaproteobacteria bacterium]|nr:hypothetical protein [Gammaproteobacteria bacterium]